MKDHHLFHLSNLFNTIECDPSSNTSSNFCACIRKNYGETLMFPDVFHVQSTSFWVLQLRWFTWAIARGLIRETENPKAWDGWSDQCAYAKRWEMISKTWVWKLKKWKKYKNDNNTNKNAHQIWWSSIPKWFLFDTCPSTWNNMFPATFQRLKSGSSPYMAGNWYQQHQH